ncbi:MAG: hypothetical protein ABSG59_04855 [Verrucomicrobiota bacterium]|jgi:hypothetical protein
MGGVVGEAWKREIDFTTRLTPIDQGCGRQVSTRARFAKWPVGGQDRRNHIGAIEMSRAKQLIETFDTIVSRGQRESVGIPTGANLRAEYRTIAIRGYQRVVEEEGVDRRNMGWIKATGKSFLSVASRGAGRCEDRSSNCLNTVAKKLQVKWKVVSRRWR